MTNNIRVFLWVGLGLALYLNYTQWHMDYGPKPTAAATTGDGSATVPAGTPDTVPQAAQQPTTATPSSSSGAVPTPATPATAAPSVEAEAPAGAKVRVTTDVLVLD